MTIHQPRKSQVCNYCRRLYTKKEVKVRHGHDTWRTLLAILPFWGFGRCGVNPSLSLSLSLYLSIYIYIYIYTINNKFRMTLNRLEQIRILMGISPMNILLTIT